MIKCKTDKFAFDSWDEAQLAVTDSKISRFLHRNKKRREVRVYICGLCQRWHLTSTPDRSVNG